MMEVFNDPLRGNPHKLVLCETQRPNGEYLENSHRHWAKEQFDSAKEEEPWFGLEQEYFMINPNINHPFGFGEKGKHGQYYCSAGANNAFGRQFAEDHLEACLAAGIKISGINTEVDPGQW
jgi:glutamine synthetase